MIVDINNDEVKVHDVIRLYSCYYFVVEDEGKLYAIPLEHQPYIKSMEMLDGEFEIVKDINQIME